MTHVVAGSNEPIESLLRRFNKKVQQDGILSEMRRHDHFETPGDKRKRKEAANRKKTARSAAR